jgi:hypothetical protein
MAPNKAISNAPIATSTVPTNEYRVKGSLRMMEAHIELKTRPDACRVDRTGRGRVVIWMVLPTTFAMTNMSMPSYAGRSARRACMVSWRHSYLPSPALIWGSPLVVIVLLFFQEMRLSLQRETDALDAGGNEADDYSQLQTPYQPSINGSPGLAVDSQ